MRKIIIVCALLALCGGASLAQKYSKQLKEVPQQSADLKGAVAGCRMGQTITEISLNNVRTYVHMDGLLWSSNESSTYNGYEIPKGSGKSSIYAGSLWISGTDIYGSIKQSTIKYKGGRNFWPGPLIAKGDAQGTTDVEVCYQYDRHFEITRYQVEAFRNWYNTPAAERSRAEENYTIPQIIHDWPAHADAAAGYDNYLAPFWDNNDDGFYNPADGDYPFYDLDGILPCGTSRNERLSHLKGDGTTWWVYNDAGNIHAGPNGEAIGMEIRAQAFQFSTNDELNDMSFYSFELINRSSYTLIDTYFGFYVDSDLGYGYDDFVGCHVSKGLGYFYNGLEIDGDGQENAYGANPPAIGFDLFEGPYQDPNGVDDCSSYDEDYKLICNECILNGNINGLNFGDGIVDNERWGMRYMITFQGAGYTGPMDTPTEHFYKMRGFWNEGEPMRYGGNGRPPYGGSGPVTDFIFPGNSDPCGWGQGGIPMPVWTEESAGNQAGDRRIVQSSGPFIMEPGAINDLTLGLIWARSFEGGPMASVDKMLLADEKAQRLFDNCFQVIDGPDAPELTIIEQDQKLIFHIWNKPNSNNYLEAYKERDPAIVCPATDIECDVYYKFQGYQLWQLKDHNASIKDATEDNQDKARLLFQCDIQDGIAQIVNYEWNQQMQANIPGIEVIGADLGIEHTLVVDEDLFAKGDSSLVNFRDYYYVVVAYAHNDFKHYDQNNSQSIEGQKQAYKAGREGANGPIKVYTATPHKNLAESPGGTVRSRMGDSPKIIQLEGHGNGLNILDLCEESIDSIMAGPPWKINALKYEAGRGPFEIKIIDPMNIIADEYTLKFDSVTHFVGSYMNGKVVNSKWYVYNSKHDTAFSEAMIDMNYDQLILQWGLSINITQQEIPFQPGALNNGFLEASIEFADPSKPWVWFVADDDRYGPRDWIRSGYANGDYSGDQHEVYEKVLGGTWAPFQQTYIGNNGVSNSDARYAVDTKRQRLANVDLYFTSDRTKWTRSPVVETTDDEALSIGQIEKFKLRDARSIDQWGVPAELGAEVDSFNMESASYLSETGLGWFPGYAIDVETGERLNIVYGESSWLTGDNGADMMWNPSPREGSKLYNAGGRLGSEGVYFGGKHFIYIMGHNATKTRRDTYYFPAYDGGQFFLDKMNDTQNRYRVRELFINAMWCSIPVLDSTYYDEKDVQEDPYGFIKGDLKLRFRVVGQYCVDELDYAKPDSMTQNDNLPMYTFNTKDMAVISSPELNALDALKLIHVVPNPYYGSQAYTSSEGENIVKVINLPETCTVSIYALNGNLIRRISNDSGQSFIDWDLKNQYGNRIASGVYIFHIDAPGKGERILKWFGAMQMKLSYNE